VPDIAAPTLLLSRLSQIDIDLRSGPMAMVWRTDPCAVLFELANRHPGGAARLLIGDEQILVFQDADAARHIARTRPDNYFKHFGPFTAYFGESRLTSDGARWSRLQKLSQPFIAATRHEDVVTAALRAFGGAINTMLSTPGEVMIEPFIDRAAASVIAEVTLGFGVEDLGAHAIEDIRRVLRFSSMAAWNYPGASIIDSDTLRAEAEAAGGRLRGGLNRLVAARALEGRALLDALIQAGDDVDLFGEVLTLLFAGADTSATAIGWAMHLLAAAPALQVRLRTEVAGVVAGTPMTLAMLGAMPQLAAFEREVLRIFPPVPILSRTAVEADRIGSIDIAAGQIVLLSVIGLHHDTYVFPNSRRVSLDRPALEGPPGQYMPFGLGRRICAGSRIASVEVATALALIVSRLDLSRSGDGPLAFEWVASLRRRGGQRLAVAPTAGVSP
jgi:cytochrome P450